ncbi:hypothetical protein MRB53_001952 [Persea americana]|uniref:Uncharacterized protein n=1 Tax=Persea americana TaxID=3435 RepID=A0ACC2MUS7_PERAE|nr:hypothetical protein MRB53_001952 [Persea americana]
MDRRTINEGRGQDDIQVCFPITQFPSRPNVPTAGKPPHEGGIKIKASQSRKQPEEVVPIDEHGPAKRTCTRTSATKSSSGSLSIEAVSQKGKVSTGTNILTSNVAMVISESPEHEASDKYNDRVDYEDSPCLDLSSRDDAHPDSAGSQGHPMHGTFMEPPFDTVRESVNSIHTLHGVKEGNVPSLLKADEPISANAKRENVGSILKPMSSVGLTSEAAKGLGTTDTASSIVVGSE